MFFVHNTISIAYYTILTTIIDISNKPNPSYHNIRVFQNTPTGVLILIEFLDGVCHQIYYGELCAMLGFV